MYRVFVSQAEENDMILFEVCSPLFLMFFSLFFVVLLKGSVPFLRGNRFIASNEVWSLDNFPDHCETFLTQIQSFDSQAKGDIVRV